MQYRVSGHGQWHEARTANVSASGVLVLASDAPEVNAAVEFRLAFGAGDAPNARGQVSGTGHVVRQVDIPLLGFAMVFDDYNFAPTLHANQA